MPEYSEARVGKTWRLWDHERLVEHLRKVDELAMELVEAAKEGRIK